MKLPRIWKKEMEFPKTPLSDIHSGYRGTPDVWKEFFNVFLEKYDLYEVKEGRTDNLLLNRPLAKVVIASSSGLPVQRLS